MGIMVCGPCQTHSYIQPHTQGLYPEYEVVISCNFTIGNLWRSTSICQWYRHKRRYSGKARKLLVCCSMCPCCPGSNVLEKGMINPDNIIFPEKRTAGSFSNYVKEFFHPFFSSVSSFLLCSRIFLFLLSFFDPFSLHLHLICPFCFFHQNILKFSLYLH